MYEQKMEVTDKAKQKQQNNGWQDPVEDSKLTVLNFDGVDGPTEKDRMVLA